MRPRDAWRIPACEPGPVVERHRVSAGRAVDARAHAVGAGEMLFVDPILPTWMPEIVVRDLRVGRARVDLRFWRGDDGASTWEVLHKQGTVRVVRQPPPESRAADVFDRAKGLLESSA